MVHFFAQLSSQLLRKDIMSSLNFPFTTKEWSVGINQYGLQNS